MSKSINTQERVKKKIADGDINGGMAHGQTGTSIFDPVLSELVYRWFCPVDGKILDPFAGGSVRGIVAGYLGYDYTGVDLIQKQVDANIKQIGKIFQEKEDMKTTTPNTDKQFIDVRISGKWSHHKFNCTEDYIKNVCHGRCCEGSDKILISLLPEEQEKYREKGYDVKDGLLQPNKETGMCPNKLPLGLCGVHYTDMQPFGCIASPFTLNNSDTLIIRNRYSLMKCHGKGEPAYKTFRKSFDLIFGKEEAERVCLLLDKTDNDITAKMPHKSYINLKYLDELKHNIKTIPVISEIKIPKWIVGDSLNINELAKGEYDLIFSCPPYYDLEIYSDMDGELSNMETYEEFLKIYKEIICKCVGILKQDRFACFVVSDIRDKKGFYRNFVSDTITAFQDAGALLYNEAILINVVGSLPIRINKQFNSGRKLGKTHQNVLIFYKGNPQNIRNNFKELDFSDDIIRKR